MRLPDEYRAWLGLGVALIALVALGAVDYFGVQALEEAAGRRARAHDVLYELEQLLAGLERLESGGRGYALSGDEEFREIHCAGRRAAEQNLGNLRRLMRDAPARSQLDGLEDSVGRRADHMARVVTARAREDAEAVRELVASGEGRRLMGQARSRIVALQDTERQDVREQDSSFAARARLTEMGILLGSVVALAVVAVAYVLLLRQAALRARVLADRQFRQQLEELELLYRTAPVGLALFDADLRYVRVNERLAAINGTPAEEHAGRTARDLVPALADTIEGFLRRVLATGSPVLDEEISGQTPARPGEERHWLASYHPLKAPDGTVRGVNAVVREVTEAKRAEEALRASEARYRSVVEDQTEFVVRWLPDGTRTFVNEAYCRYFGLTREQAVGVSFFPLVAEEDREAVRRKVASLTPDVPAAVDEHRVIRPDGTPGWNEWTDRGCFDETGRLVEVQSVGRDITRRKQAEEALRRSEDRFRALVEKSGDAITLVDAEGREGYSSPSTVRVTGYTSQEREGRDAFELVHPDDDAAVRARFRELLQTPGGEVQTECRVLHKDGSWHWLDCHATNRLDDPSVGAIVVNFRDVTKRRQAEEEVRASRGRLQVLSRQLIDAQEKERRRLARELHDEIGQVLTAVSINLQNAKESCGPAAAPRLEESIAVVAKAIQQVRDLSLNLRPAMLDDFGLAAAIKWYAERQGELAGLRVHLDVRTTGERLPGELEAACFRVAQEALTNVVRHARAQTVRVTLRQRDEEVRLEVHDDGAGFDVEAARRRAAAGASLGLLGMRERVELLGGEFELLSAPGQGTTIRVRLSAGNDFANDEGQMTND